MPAEQTTRQQIMRDANGKIRVVLLNVMRADDNTVHRIHPALRINMTIVVKIFGQRSVHNNITSVANVSAGGRRSMWLSPISQPITRNPQSPKAPYIRGRGMTLNVVRRLPQKAHSARVAHLKEPHRLLLERMREGKYLATHQMKGTCILLAPELLVLCRQVRQVHSVMS